jgi:proton-translocating NADH-quinone oxidoreductase chain L
MERLVVIAPLCGAVRAGLGGRWLGGEGAARLTTSLVGRAFVVSLASLVKVGRGGEVVTIYTRPWRVSGSYSIEWSFLYDSLTVVRRVVVTSISSLVHLYSRSYRGHDPHRARFRAYLSLFTFFRLILVTGGNLVQRFVGWEGVGLCSYLLINFWFTRLQANKAAIKARLVNRVGDFGLVLGRLRLYELVESLDYGVLFSRAPRVAEESGRALTVACLLLFVGAVGKSAQLGLHTWLPDAREGPTPVSALIHAATRVTAGVFLLARCSPLFEYAPRALQVVRVVGGATAFFAATTALTQSDLKRVIAYSTCSQLGYRVFATGLSAYSVAVFHLSNHAFFKALLFLGAGSVIHARGDEQDRRRRGGLVRVLPLTYAGRFIGSVALRGFPFLTGFYSKDVILEVAYGSYSTAGRVAYRLGARAARCTAYYSRRLLYLTFLAPANGHRVIREGAHDAPLPRAVPLRLLAIGSIFIGWLSKDRFIGVGTSYWNGALFTHPERLVALDGEFLPAWLKLAPVVASIRSAVFAVRLLTGTIGGNWGGWWSTAGRRRVFTFLNRKWLFDKVYNERVSQTALDRGYRGTYRLLDRGVFELVGPYGLANRLYRRSEVTRGRQTGHVYHYGLARLTGSLLVLVGLIASGVGVDSRVWRVRLGSLIRRVV